VLPLVEEAIEKAHRDSYTNSHSYQDEFCLLPQSKEFKKITADAQAAVLERVRLWLMGIGVKKVDYEG